MFLEPGFFGAGNYCAAMPKSKQQTKVSERGQRSRVIENASTWEKTTPLEFDRESNTHVLSPNGLPVGGTAIS